jgi:pimeloyl-ACP methyl ester carboxylesterase
VPYGINRLPAGQQSVSGAQAIERVVFASRRGVRLVGLWHRAASPAGVILCHGMEACKEGVKSARLATELAAREVNALRFDFSYVGESEGSFLDLTVSGEVEDLAGAWAFARRRLSGPLGLLGSSLGGTVALLFAADEPDVAALATIAAVAHPGRRARALPAAERARWRREGSYDLHGIRVGSAFLDDVERLDVEARIGTVACPLLLTHGTADEVVPPSDADAIAAQVAHSCTVQRYEGADHRFSNPVLLDVLLADVVDWMVAALRDAESRRGAAWVGGAHAARAR